MPKKGTAPLDGLGLVKERLRAGIKPPIADLIGFDLVGVGRGWSAFEMIAGPKHSNPMGTLHGGVLCDIADAAMGIAYLSTLERGESFTTMEMKVNFLRPVWSARLVAKGKIIKKGRTTGLLECRVVDEEGHLVAYATSTCLTLSEPAGDIRRPVRKS